MTPIAAYYVMINTDLERALRMQRHDSIASKASFLARVVEGLETLVRLGRPATTQPI